MTFRVRFSLRNPPCPPKPPPTRVPGGRTPWTPPNSWYYPISDRGLAALDRIIRDPKIGDRPVAELKATDELRAACADEIGRASDALENGRGFAVISVPPDRYSAKEQSAAYWLVGQLLGTAVRAKRPGHGSLRREGHRPERAVRGPIQRHERREHLSHRQFVRRHGPRLRRPALLELGQIRRREPDRQRLRRARRTAGDAAGGGRRAPPAVPRRPPRWPAARRRADGPLPDLRRRRPRTC